MTAYVINEKFYFDSDLNEIKNLENDIVVQLHATASSCFHLLLERHGTIVPKEEIYDLVWHRYGLTVIDNTYYQMVLHLRKNIEKSGVPDSVIKTVPRKGLLIPAAIVVKVVSVNEPIQEPVQILDKDLLGDPQSSANIDNGNITKFNHKITIKNCMMIAIFFSISAGSIYCVFNGYLKLHEEVWQWSDYHYIGMHDQCKIFIKGERALLLSQSLLKDEAIKERCKTLPYLYITKHNAIKRESIIMCQHEVSSKKNKCISIYSIIK